MTFNFNGNWQSTELTQSRRSGLCEDILAVIPLRFPAFSYNVEQVGENITLRDDTGVLTGADRGDSFTVSDESANPGEIIDPATLEPPYNDPTRFECRVFTSITYVGDSEFSGSITVRFRFECLDLIDGLTDDSCVIEYSGFSDRL